MTQDVQPPRRSFTLVRNLLWVLVVLAVAGTAALVLLPRAPKDTSTVTVQTETNFGGPFTLVGSDGKPFSSAALAGKPYAIYFGFTRCGDVCPTTLARLTKLRDQAGGRDAFNILFVTIDPANDGPKEVGQYATLFNAPIIGLTGSQTQIDQVKKQYGIFAQPSATVLLFGRDGKLAGTIATDEPDAAALAKLKRLTA
jgi:protein SCO1/2